MVLVEDPLAKMLNLNETGSDFDHARRHIDTQSRLVKEHIASVGQLTDEVRVLKTA